MGNKESALTVLHYPPQIGTKTYTSQPTVNSNGPYCKCALHCYSYSCPRCRIPWIGTHTPCDANKLAFNALPWSQDLSEDRRKLGYWACKDLQVSRNEEYGVKDDVLCWKCDESERNKPRGQFDSWEKEYYRLKPLLVPQFRCNAHEVGKPIPLP